MANLGLVEDFDDLLQWLGPALEGVGEDLLVPGQSTQMPDFLNPQLAPQPLPFAFATRSAASTDVDTLSAPSTYTHQEQPVSSQPSGSSKARRKRPPTSQQQVAELEKQIAVQTTLLQQLSTNNLYLTERVRMLEMVISIRDAQVARIQEIQEGLKFNPFVSMGITPEELTKATPGWMASKFLDLTSKAALLLAPLLPHIQRYPHLIWGPDKTSHWQSSRNTFQQGGPPQAPAPAAGAAATTSQGTGTGPSGVDGPDAAVLRDLQTLVTMMDGLQAAFRYCFWFKPQMLLASSVHAHAIDPNEHTQWDHLLSKVRTAHAEGGAAPTAPPVAPESHWQGVAKGLMLSDHQKLQASVLWDLINKAITSVVAHRASLGAAMAKLQQDKPPSAPSAPSSAPPSAFQSGSLDVPAPVPGQSLMESRTSGSGQLSASTASGPGGVSSAGQLWASAAKAGSEQLSGSASMATSASIGNMANGVTLPLPCAASIGSFNRMQQEEAIMKKLQLTLVKQGCLVILGAEALFNRIVSPVQLAMIMVCSYPFVPDDMALMHALAAECTPEVLGRLRSTPSSA